jgi:hypothetical protein
MLCVILTGLARSVSDDSVNRRAQGVAGWAEKELSHPSISWT